MHLALIKYSVLRLAIFVAALALLWLVGVRESIAMFVIAALVSMALSYLLLKGPRDQLALAIAERTRARIDRRQQLGQSDADAEDAAYEQSQAANNQAATNQASRE